MNLRAIVRGNIFLLNRLLRDVKKLRIGVFLDIQSIEQCPNEVFHLRD